MPDDLRPQIERIRQMVDAFHLPRLEQEGVEADDVLGTIAYQAVEMGLGVKIITGDRDLLQLVNDRIVVNLAGSKLSEAKSYTASDVKAFLGVASKPGGGLQGTCWGSLRITFTEYPGSGRKPRLHCWNNTRRWTPFTPILNAIPPRYSAKLIDGKDSAYLSQKLAQIKTDVPVKLVLEDAKTDHINIPAVETLFRELEFRTLIPRLHAIVAPMVKQAPGGQMNLFGSEVKEISVPAAYELKSDQWWIMKKSWLNCSSVIGKFQKNRTGH